MVSNCTRGIILLSYVVSTSLFALRDAYSPNPPTVTIPASMKASKNINRVLIFILFNIANSFPLTLICRSLLPAFRLHLEPAHRTLQLSGQLLQAHDVPGVRFHCRMVLFRHLRDLLHVARNLGAGQALLAHRGRDVAYAVAGFRHRFARFGQYRRDMPDLLLRRLQGMQAGLDSGFDMGGFL